MILRAATVHLEIAHRGLDGEIHGHSLALEVWTDQDVDLDVYASKLRTSLAFIGAGLLENTIGGRTFEDVGATVLAETGAVKVIVRLPSRGYAIEMSNT